MFTRLRTGGLVLTLALTASVAQGCGRSRDCTRLADLANRRGAEIAQIGRRASDTPRTLGTDMQALAEVAARAVEDVRSLQFDDASLRARARAYGQTARELADASESYAALMNALRAHRESKRDAQSKFEASGEALLEACATPSTDCNAVGELLREQPENPEPSKLGKILDTYVRGLESLDLHEGPVSNAVAVRIAATKAYKAVVTRQTTLETDIERTRSEIHQAVDRQNALIDQLNVFCVGKE